MEARLPTCAAIRAAVCAVWDVSEDEIVSQRRDPQIVAARHAAIWLSRRLTDQSMAQISRHYGDRDHSTISSAIHRVDRLRHVDRDLSENLESVAALLNCTAAISVESEAERRDRRRRAIRIIARIERDLAELRQLLVDEEVDDGPRPDRQGGVA